MPPNEWWVKLCDLGLSKRAEDIAGSSTVRGTPGFWAPETLGFHTLENSFPTDMWCLGETVYQMLTGQGSFGFVAELIHYQSGHIPFPRQVLMYRLASPAAIQFVESLMAADPFQRPTAEMAQSHLWMWTNAQLNNSYATSNLGIQAREPRTGVWPPTGVHGPSYPLTQASGQWTSTLSFRGHSSIAPLDRSRDLLHVPPDQQQAIFHPPHPSHNHGGTGTSSDARSLSSAASFHFGQPSDRTVPPSTDWNRATQPPAFFRGYSLYAQGKEAQRNSPVEGSRLLPTELQPDISIVEEGEEVTENSSDESTDVRPRGPVTRGWEEEKDTKGIPELVLTPLTESEYVGSTAKRVSSAVGNRAVATDMPFANKANNEQLHATSRDGDLDPKSGSSMPRLPRSGQGQNGELRTSSQLPEAKEKYRWHTHTVEHDVLESFKQFAAAHRAEWQRVKAQRPTDQMDTREELKLFSQNFSLRTPVPKDLIPLLAKNHAKQQEIVARQELVRRQQDAASTHRGVTDPSGVAADVSFTLPPNPATTLNSSGSGTNASADGQSSAGHDQQPASGNWSKSKRRRYKRAAREIKANHPAAVV